MDETKSVFSDLGKGIADYAESWYKLAVLSGTKKATHAAAFLLTLFSVLFLGLFVLFFAGLALGIWLGELMNNQSAGYIMVAAAFLAVLIILVMLRNKIVFPFIRDAIVRKLYENNP